MVLRYCSVVFKWELQGKQREINTEKGGICGCQSRIYGSHRPEVTQSLWLLSVFHGGRRQANNAVVDQLSFQSIPGKDQTIRYTPPLTPFHSI
jgi:hypothetical protein